MTTFLTTDAPANLRDVRGLRTGDGRIVRRGVLYRSEMPIGTAGDVAVPVWPPSVVVDLRVPGEHPAPHPFDVDGVVLHRIPLGRELAPGLVAGAAAGGEFSALAAYRLLVQDAAAEIARIVGIVAAAPGPVLVHCTAGKDRTGIVVAILLRAAGVTRADVLADYRRTEANLPRLWERLLAAGVPSPRNPALLGVHPAALELLLDELDAHPGGAAGWLAARGVPAEDLARLRARLVA